MKNTISLVLALATMGMCEFKNSTMVTLETRQRPSRTEHPMRPTIAYKHKTTASPEHPVIEQEQVNLVIVKVHVPAPTSGVTAKPTISTVPVPKPLEDVLSILHRIAADIDKAKAKAKTNSTGKQLIAPIPKYINATQVVKPKSKSVIDEIVSSTQKQYASAQNRTAAAAQKELVASILKYVNATMSVKPKPPQASVEKLLSFIYSLQKHAAVHKHIVTEPTKAQLLAALAKQATAGKRANAGFSPEEIVAAIKEEIIATKNGTDNATNQEILAAIAKYVAAANAGVVPSTATVAPYFSTAKAASATGKPASDST